MVYYTPTKVVFGKDAELQAGAMLAGQGARKVLIHYGSERVVKTGLMKKITDQLDKEGISYTLLGGVQPNPRLALARKGIEAVKAEGLDFILAVGGGSVIDSAKCIGYGAVYDGDVWDFYSGKAKPSGSMGIGVVLTLSATGSEMSDSSVITNDDGGLKRGVNTDYCRPAFALLNPELTYTVSRYQTSCGTVDIMMHTLERFFHSGSGLDLTDQLSIALIKEVMKSGLKALQDPSDYDARANLMWASSLSHNGLMQAGNEQRGDWACHQLEHELSGIWDVAHGAGLAAIWATWARYVYRENPARFAMLGEGIFGFAPSDNVENDALRTIASMEEFFHSLEMPINLRELGINPTEKELDLLAEKCSFFSKRTVGAFKVLSKEDMRNIYKAAI